MKNLVTFIAALGIMFSAVPAIPAYAADAAQTSIVSEASPETTDIEHLAGQWKYQISDTNLNVNISPTDYGTFTINKDGTFSFTGNDGLTSSGKVEFSIETIGGTPFQCISLYEGQERIFGGYYHSNDPDTIYYGNNWFSRIVRKEAAEAKMSDFVGSWKYQEANVNCTVDVSASDKGNVEINADGTYKFTYNNGVTETGTVYLGDETIGGTLLTVLRFYNGSSQKYTATYLPERADELYIGNGGMMRLVRDSAPAAKVKGNGDANCDGNVDMSDAVLIMQALSNPNKYGTEGTAAEHITAAGVKNADVDGDGLTVNDALHIQKYLLGEISF